MSHTFAIFIYDPCPKCDAPFNPYHLKNGCTFETKKVKKVKKLVIVEDDEDDDVCGKTGREFDLKNPVKGCGIKLRDYDENIMIGNISFCEKCANSPEGQKAMEDEDNDT
tara:strand:+ start:292 stop:621 length:330 start_codon:yes stop_codon:yes gene_type:complete